MFLEDGEIYVEKTDQCYRCKIVGECPLVHAIIEGIVLMATQDFRVKHCPSFDGPGLKAVPGGRSD